jgi:hypothetical protein
MRTNGMSAHKLPFLKFNLKKPKKSFSSNSKYNSDSLNRDSFYEWFVGFTDGEGNFTIGVDNRAKIIRFNFRFTIGLHADEHDLLELIKNKLNCGQIYFNNSKTACNYTITDPYAISSIIFPIFDKFPLNTTKYLDYLCFKEALSIYLNPESFSDSKTKMVDHIINLKNQMNNSRTDFSLPHNHIKITNYWLLGLIEAEGSFHLRRNSLSPAFSISLSKIQKPLLEKIVEFLINKLDDSSKFKAINSKNFNLSEESTRGNAKAMVKLLILQIDYLNNIFVPYFSELKFLSKKKFDFLDFKLLTILIYQGKFLNPEIKIFILKLSYTMNSYRLTSYNKFPNDYFLDLNQVNLWKLERINLENLYLNLPPYFLENNEGEIINVETKKVIRDIYIIKAIKLDNSVNFYTSISECALDLSINRFKVKKLIITGDPLIEMSILKITKIKVFKQKLT